MSETARQFAICLSWIRYLRRMRRELGLGEMERAALVWNLQEARRLREWMRR